MFCFRVRAHELKITDSIWVWSCRIRARDAVSQVTRVGRFFNLTPLSPLFGCWVLTNSFFFPLSPHFVYRISCNGWCKLHPSLFIFCCGKKTHTHIHRPLDLVSVILSVYTCRTVEFSLGLYCRTGTISFACRHFSATLSTEPTGYKFQQRNSKPGVNQHFQVAAFKSYKYVLLHNLINKISLIQKVP